MGRREGEQPIDAQWPPAVDRLGDMPARDESALAVCDKRD